MELSVPVVTAALATLSAVIGLIASLTKRSLLRERDAESARLRSVVIGGDEPRTVIRGDIHGDVRVDLPPAGGEDKGTRAGDQRVDDDRFAELLIEYYAWGLTQARRSTSLSLTASGVGVFVLLVGVALAIWKAETTGDLYASAVASVAGLVSTVIGQLAHRRADSAMTHMQKQTDSLRQDMKRERETETAIRLAGEILDPELRAELQAALVLKLSGATLSEVRAPFTPPTTIPSQEGSLNGTTR